MLRNLLRLIGKAGRAEEEVGDSLGSTEVAIQPHDGRLVFRVLLLDVIPNFFPRIAIDQEMFRHDRIKERSAELFCEICHVFDRGLGIGIALVNLCGLLVLADRPLIVQGSRFVGFDFRNDVLQQVLPALDLLRIQGENQGPGDGISVPTRWTGQRILHVVHVPSLDVRAEAVKESRWDH